MQLLKLNPRDIIMAIDKVTSAAITDGTITSSDLASGAVQNQSAFKNIIINGDMSVAQRGTSSSGITSDGYYTVDRFLVENGSFGTWTQSQAADAPTGQGYYNSLKMDCTTAQGSPSSNSILLVGQSIEGFMLQPIKQGTANAESTTLSFWHKHTKTGTNIVELLDADNSNAVSGSYTQSVSDTWEKATITFPANTSGTYDNDNARSLRIRFIMGAGTDYTSGTLATTWQTSITNANRYAGQVNNADSTSNNFIITGVQYEVGTSASDFEFLPVDVNSMRCFRYYYMFADRVNSDQRAIGLGVVHYVNQVTFEISYPTPMRANPSVDQVYATDIYQFYHNTTGDDFDGIDAIATVGNRKTLFRNSTDISASVNECGQVYVNDASCFMAADAEL